MMFAQKNHTKVAQAVNARKPFTTSGNLSGDTYLSKGFGRIRGAAESRLETHVRDRKLDYVLYSYSTPVAWLADGRWHVDAHRYGQASDQAMRTVSAVARRSGLEVITYRMRHGLSDAQVNLLHLLSGHYGHVWCVGSEKRSAVVLERRGFAEWTSSGALRITPLGVAALTGTGVSSIDGPL